ncbi:MAG TPA: hypothetical protein PLQ12_06275, partial [Candidatus Defluviicoccus seviourii]|nr:hypothetical protein [Candidatus Defluviicoccus seviourii]
MLAAIATSPLTIATVVGAGQGTCANPSAPIPKVRNATIHERHKRRQLVHVADVLRGRRFNPKPLRQRAQNRLAHCT